MNPDLGNNTKAGKSIFFSRYCRLDRWKFEMTVAPVLPDTFETSHLSSVILEHLELHVPAAAALRELLSAPSLFCWAGSSCFTLNELFFVVADINVFNVNKLCAEATRTVSAPHFVKRRADFCIPVMLHMYVLATASWEKSNECFFFPLWILWLIAVVTAPSQVCNGLDMAANATNLPTVLMTNMWLSGIGSNATASPSTGHSVLIS